MKKIIWHAAVALTMNGNLGLCACGALVQAGVNLQLHIRDGNDELEQALGRAT